MVLDLVVWDAEKGTDMFTAAIIGHLGAPCELKYNADGMPTLTFNVAANFSTRDNGEWVKKTEWVKVTAIGKRHLPLVDQLFKGTKVYASGKLSVTPWTDKQGNLRSGIKIVADTIEPAGNPKPVTDQVDLDDILEA